MPATVGPQVPPRPARSPSTATAAAPSSLSEVLPRGSLKDSSRINTPNNYPRSPLFDPPSTQSLSRPVSTEVSDPTLPRRPPSVNLPSIGQEGSEYADISYAATEQDHSPALEQPGHVEKVVGDVKLHAPKPSLPEASAKAQVKTVTRTNDQQAAAHGFGKAGGYDHEEAGGSVMSPSLQPPSILGSTSQSSPPSSRRQSVALPEDEPTPAELGLRVPINPDAGAVQAPPPASHPSSTDHPYHHHHHHHHTSRKRHHARTPSGREASLPPGSYGLHGHGVHTHDKFDKDWYAKHPDQLAREEESVHGHYSAKGSGRGEWAMSHDDLNRIVRDTASRGAGLGERACENSHMEAAMLMHNQAPTKRSLGIRTNRSASSRRTSTRGSWLTQVARICKKPNQIPFGPREIHPLAMQSCPCLHRSMKGLQWLESWAIRMKVRRRALYT